MTCESVTRILEMDGVEGLGEPERAHIAQCPRCAASVKAVESLNASMQRLSRVSSAGAGPENPRLLAVIGASRPKGRARTVVMLVVLAGAALLAAVVWQDWMRGPLDQDSTVMSPDSTERASSHGERTPITE
ncbi:MAG: hypothetical protein AAGJ56_02995 [Myxococcota bacterium]